MNKHLTISEKIKDPFSHKLAIQNATNKNNDYKELNVRLNSKNFRCDEFTSEHKGLHILFSGCSVTFGDGLLEDETWAKDLYNKIKKDHEVSGYFNLGVSGSNIFDVITNIFRYITEFEKPDVIFISLPSIRRYVFHKDETTGFSNLHNSVYVDGSGDEYSEVARLQSFQYLFALEVFCKLQNIKLYCFTYDIARRYSPMDLDSYFEIDINDITKFISEYCIDNPSDEFAIKARDNSHYGTAYHKYWSNFCYNLYLGGV